MAKNKTKPASHLPMAQAEQVSRPALGLSLPLCEKKTWCQGTERF